MTDEELRAALDKYKWYHTIKLSPTVTTPGRADFAAHAPPVLRQMAAIDFQGKRVVDIGCRDGLFCFEAERLGASDILGVDTSLSLGAVELLIPYLRSRVRIQERSLFDLNVKADGIFDIVIFSGVLYHLRYPFLGIQTLEALLPEGGRMIVETGIFADDDQRALLFCPIGKESPYEPSSVTFFNRKGMIDTLRSFGLRVDVVDYSSEKSRTMTDGKIVRGTFLCTKVSALKAEHPHNYWTGGTHNTWQKKSSAS
jgi:SAM-dependent methyltransferase